MQTKLAFFLFLLLFSCSSIEDESVNQKPNVLLILTDDQGFGDIAIHGNDSIDTPVQDKLAKEGIRMNHFYVSPVCAPTRASLLTGRYHYRTGTTWVTRNAEAMKSEEVTLAELFKANGYTTGCFGKWHNGAHYPQGPFGQGFDEFLGFRGGHWNRFNNPDLEVDGQMQKVEGYITDIFTDAAMDFIDTNKDEPFFAYVPYNTPHTPYITPEPLYQKYKEMGLSDANASIHGMVENIDQNVGRLLGQLEALKILDNTLVIFMTDNGPNGDRYVAGMKGKKGSISDGGVRVPCFFYWKDHLNGGQIIDELTAHIDIFPTLVELLDLDPIETLPLDGQSFSPLLTGTNDTLKDRTFFTFHTGLNPYKGSVRTRDYRLTINKKNQYQLTRLMEDPGEKNNLVDELPELAKSMYNAYLSKYEEVTKGQALSQAIPVDFSISPKVDLPAHEGFPKGGIQFKSSPQGYCHDWFTNWTSEQDTMNWKFDVAKAGQYQLYLKYDCASNHTGATIYTKTESELIQASMTKAFTPKRFDNTEQVSRGRVAYDQTWGELFLGSLSLNEGLQSIDVFANNIQNGKIGDVKGLILRKEN